MPDPAIRTIPMEDFRDRLLATFGPADERRTTASESEIR
jgi:hypothetical protein